MRVHYQSVEASVWEEVTVRLSSERLVNRLDRIDLVHSARCTQVRGFKRKSPAVLDLSGLELADGRQASNSLELFHAIRLPDGRIWDVVNGWRSNTGDQG